MKAAFHLPLLLLLLAMAGCTSLPQEPGGMDDFVPASKWPAADVQVTGTRMSAPVSAALAKVFPHDPASSRHVQAVVRLGFREMAGTDDTGSDEATLGLSLTVREGAHVALKKDYSVHSSAQSSREVALDEALATVLQTIEKDLRH